MAGDSRTNRHASSSIVRWGTRIRPPGRPSGSVRLSSNWVEEWLASKRNQGCSSGTLAQYRWALARIPPALEKERRTRDPSQWTEEDLAWIRNRFHDRVGFVRLLRAVLVYFDNPVARDVRIPWGRREIRTRWLTEAQTQAILEVVRRDAHLRLVVLLGLGQGLRRGDWVRLRVSDIDLESREIRVRSSVHESESRPRWVPMHPALPDALLEYAVRRRRRVRRFLRRHPGATVPDELFVHLYHGVLSPYRPHGTDKWMVIIERRLARRGVTLRLSTDMLRRQAAVLAVRSFEDQPDLVPEDVDRRFREFLRVRAPRYGGLLFRAAAAHAGMERAIGAPKEALGPAG